MLQTRTLQSLVYQQIAIVVVVVVVVVFVVVVIIVVVVVVLVSAYFLYLCTEYITHGI